MQPEKPPTASSDGVLPARLRHPGDHPLGGEFAEGHTGHLEAANERATTTGDTAAVDETRRACITRKHGETDEIAFLLEFSTEFSVLCDGFTFALVALEPACFCHRGAESGPKPRFRKKKFLLANGLFHAKSQSLWSSLLECVSPPHCFSAVSSSSPTL
jgi:hypothetical protein